MLPAIVACLILGLIAALHFLWASGSHWPAQSEADLARRVTGFARAVTMPPRWASVGVGAVMMTACYVLLANAGALPTLGPIWLYRIALWGLMLVFVARGIAAFTPQWRALTPEQPFATLDRRYFGPLCLVLAGLIFLTLR